MNPLKKENRGKNPFFLIMLNEVLQMISSNVKANVKQQQTKDLAFVP